MLSVLVQIFGGAAGAAPGAEEEEEEEEVVEVFNDVWSSVDGKEWVEERTSVEWSPRHSFAYVS